MAAPRRSRKVIWLLVAGAGIAAWQLGPRFLQRRAGTDRLVNQLWIERVARDERDQVGFFAALEKDGKRQGVVGHASRWRSHTEGFVWALDGNLLRARFPQDQRNARVRVRTWHCADEAPRPFELCLEITAGERSRRYYSRDGWRIRPHDASLDDEARGQALWVAPALRPLDGLPAEEPSEDDAQAPGPSPFEALPE
jgi:hypothetical protein